MDYNRINESCQETNIKVGLKQALIGSIFIGLLSGFSGLAWEAATWATFSAYFLQAYVLSASIWSSNVAVSAWSFKKFPSNEQMVKRLVIQTGLNTLAALGLVFILLLFTYLWDPSHATGGAYYGIIVFTLMITLLINAVYVGQYFFSKWRIGILQQKELELAHQFAQLEALRGQMDPHFLFNAFTTLAELIHEDPNRASEYVEQLSRVYRYILDHSKAGLVTLKDEMKFLRSYVYLLETKYGQSLQVKWPNEPIDEIRWLPVLATQIAIENVIKHNRIDAQNPMEVLLYFENELFKITNRIQPKKSQPAMSHGFGLKNLAERYNILLAKKPEVFKDGHFFTLALPLKILSHVPTETRTSY